MCPLAWCSCQTSTRRVVGLARRLLRGVTGEGEEDVVERRAVDLEVVDLDAGLVERADERGREPGPRCDRRREHSTVVGDLDRTGDERSEGTRRRPGARRRARTSSRSPPTFALSSSEVPSAITVPWSMTEMRSASASASSRYCVVSSTVVPSATRVRMTSHMRLPARRVEAGGRLVEEQHRRAGDEAGGEIEPAAHAARVRLHHAVGGERELELLEQLLGACRCVLLRHASTGGRPCIRFWVPVSSSSSVASCPVTPMMRRTSAASRDHVEAADARPCPRRAMSWW